MVVTEKTIPLRSPIYLKRMKIVVSELRSTALPIRQVFLENAETCSISGAPSSKTQAWLTVSSRVTDSIRSIHKSNSGVKYPPPDVIVKHNIIYYYYFYRILEHSDDRSPNAFAVMGTTIFSR